jgi:hypothetical protein
MPKILKKVKLCSPLTARYVMEVEGKGDGPITKDRSVTDSRGTRQLSTPPPSYHRTDAASSSRVV